MPSYKPDTAMIEEALRAGIGGKLADLQFENFNYDFTFGLKITLKDGRRTAYMGGLVNRPGPDEDCDDWQPVTKRLEDAIPAAIAWANAA